MRDVLECARCIAEQAQTLEALIALAVFAAGGAVVKLTPTKTDDAWWQKIKTALRGATSFVARLFLRR